jgi:hypothetical protein
VGVFTLAAGSGSDRKRIFDAPARFCKTANAGVAAVMRGSEFLDWASCCPEGRR